MSETSVPEAFLETGDGVRDPLMSRLLATCVALGGEVFVLKAELERMKRVLAASGAASADALEAVRREPSFAQWMAQEERDFAAHLLDPIARERMIAAPGKA
jgi:hypothetical protein